MTPRPTRAASRSRRLRGVAVAGVVTGLVTALAPAASTPADADQTYYVPISKAWTIRGHGYGHGHGMSQYGAQGAALQGLGYRKIIGFYYPGTTWSKAKGLVRVLISADYTSDVQVRPQRGLQARDQEAGKGWTLPTAPGIDRWRFQPKGRSVVVQFHNARGWHLWNIPGPTSAIRGTAEFATSNHALTLLVPGGSDVIAKRYRGVIRSVAPFNGATVRDTVNVLTMDSYVRGVVPYEMPASWAANALRSQAVAARTYAAWQRAQNPRRYYQICDTTACQVYGGVGAEQSSSNNAVRATAQQILTYQGKPAFTQFSASSGGWTAAGGQPYLPAKRDPYDGFTGNSVHSWAVKVSASALERSHPEIGRLQYLQVTRRDGHGAWNGRVIQLVLHGSKGKALIAGDDFRWQYGLRSSWFTIAPTPIIQRWRQIGAANSSVGKPRSPEYALANGSAQDFATGRIFWSAETAAREMVGPPLFAYRAFGGPGSRLGWPETGVLAAPRQGHKVRLQGGYIYSRPKVGGQVMFGPILHRWARVEGGPAGHLGYPTSNVHAVPAGKRATFEHGTITWVRSTDTFHVVER